MKKSDLRFLLSLPVALGAVIWQRFQARGQSVCVRRLNSKP